MRYLLKYIFLILSFSAQAQLQKAEIKEKALDNAFQAFHQTARSYQGELSQLADRLSKAYSEKEAFYFSEKLFELIKK